MNLGVERKEWKAVRVVKTGNPISHLFFTDYLLLFGKASSRQDESMKEILEVFCA